MQNKNEKTDGFRRIPRQRRRGNALEVARLRAPKLPRRSPIEKDRSGRAHQRVPLHARSSARSDWVRCRLCRLAPACVRSPPDRPHCARGVSAAPVMTIADAAGSSVFSINVTSLSRIAPKTIGSGSGNSRFEVPWQAPMRPPDCEPHRTARGGRRAASTICSRPGHRTSRIPAAMASAVTGTTRPISSSSLTATSAFGI